MIYYETKKNELYHHGILGQKWGVRRYQKADGTRTEAGKKRYSDQQRIRDEKIYGKKAAQRIERRVAQGEGVQSARHDEAVKRSSAPGKKRIGIGVAKAAVGAGMVTASALAVTGKGKVGKQLQRVSNQVVSSFTKRVGLSSAESMVITRTVLIGLGSAGVKELYSSGKDVVYGARDIERNRTKLR